MKEKSDDSKILEGRCQGHGSDYVGFKKANESHSKGTATQIYDPIADRIVDVLSMGEYYLFWLLRANSHVVEINEQVMMAPHLVAKAANELGIRVPKRIITTDFKVVFDDGTIKAYSVKASRNELCKETCKSLREWERTVRRQALEKRYWENLQIEWNIVFTEEMPIAKAENISAIMQFYNSRDVQTPDQMYRFLIANGHIKVDLDRPLNFAQIANEYEEDIRKIYERVTCYEY